MVDNVDLGKTQITPLIRVSSAAVGYPVQRWGGCYWQIETFIFSDDPRQATRQIIHGTQSCGEGEPFRDAGATVEKCRHVHARIAANLLKKYGGAS